MDGSVPVAPIPPSSVAVPSAVVFANDPFNSEPTQAAPRSVPDLAAPPTLLAAKRTEQANPAPVSARQLSSFAGMKAGIIVGLVAGVLVAVCGFWAWYASSQRGDTTVTATPSQLQYSSGNQSKPSPYATSTATPTNGHDDSSSEAEIWTDTTTGLAWARTDSGRDMKWQEANDYCINMTLAGSSDWRLPKIAELQSIYDPDLSSSDGRQIDRSLPWQIKGNIHLSAWGEWSSTMGDSPDQAWVFGFGAGKPFKYRFYGQRNPNALCVRTDQPTAASGNESAMKDAVEGWAQAFRSRDTVTLAGYYAPVVEQYFKKTNIERAQVQLNFESGFSNITNINRYEITDMRIDFIDGASRATATFNKQWDTSQIDGKTFSGEEIERLTFASYPEGWKIVREEELQIIRASRY
jgi:ketosteroid isomerase-like protein